MLCFELREFIERLRVVEWLMVEAIGQILHAPPDWGFDAVQGGDSCAQRMIGARFIDRLQLGDGHDVVVFSFGQPGRRYGALFQAIAQRLATWR